MSLYSRSLVVQTKIVPPRVQRRILVRPRLTRRLLESLDYRLTLVLAGTGYGKSTALAALTESGCALAWYHLDKQDADPLVFFSHLFASLRVVLPAIAAEPLAGLRGWKDGLALPWATFVDLLVNELAAAAQSPVLLVLDDAHVLRNAGDVLDALDRLVERAPAHVHTVLSTRHPPNLPSLVAWQAKGQVLEIRQRELAFTPAEIEALFGQHYDLALPADEIAQLAATTEGWVMALQLVWQGLRSGAVTTISQALGKLTLPTDPLFAYLAQEILAQQPAEVQDFLHLTAVLREMSAPLCDCLRQSDDSAAWLRYLLEGSFFVVDLGNGHVRYHHLFHEFLCHHLDAMQARRAHLAAAACYRKLDDLDEALYHLLVAEAFGQAADLLNTLGQQMVRVGRLDTLSNWLNALPPTVLEENPRLLAYQGDIARLRSRFDEALGWYRQAEQRARLQSDWSAVGQALRGQARVYLDTVNPTQAESLLQEALRLSDGQQDRQARANLLELMAENRLNLGHPDQAEQFQSQARALREEGPGEAELSVRVLLRTGQHDQARRLLEERVQQEQQEPVQRPRAHRETLLLFSLILAFRGEGEAAYRYAMQGIERGRALQSPFVTAVGYMRQGHAWLLRGDSAADAAARYDQACHCYREAIKWSDTLAVPRLKVEAYWGLCRAHGFVGALDAAERAAGQAISLAEQAGDAWITALVRVSLGASYALVGKAAAAAEWLSQAWNAFHECGDSYGQAVTRLWQCLMWCGCLPSERSPEAARLSAGLHDLLELVQQQQYDYLLTRQTLLGPADPRRLTPLLLLAREWGIGAGYAGRVLAQLGLNDLEFHPGYQLRVQTLGAFRVWRGDQEIAAGEWQRENARLLLQALLTRRAGLLEREQIVDLLWPDQPLGIALRDFKVALSTLFKVLEPNRQANAPSAYITREGSLYGLRPGADLWLDVEAFERAVAEGDRAWDTAPETALAAYRRAIELYQGDYLQEHAYLEWCRDERERLLALYLRAADRLAHALIERGFWSEAVPVCEALLARDNCWEKAYRLLMLAYAQTGNRAQALRTYQRCVERLRDELDIAPSPEIEQLYASLL
ncbi:MAG: transcriptional regulator [Anaerolineae bacterium]|nr:transcriptional regulator [Anaerolineae bacterium]